jgi:cytochrome P450
MLTSQVFKESLRIYPPLYMLVRQAMEDVTIGRWLVPKGTVLLVSPYVIHRHPEMWPNPEQFDPSRFTAAAEQARPRSAYLPFGAGPRTCIGNHFAIMEATIVLATLLQRARFEVKAPVEPEPSATLRPRGGMPMRVSLRGRNTVPTNVTPLG